MSHLSSYSCQSIDQDDIDAVVAVLNSEFLTQGPATAAFERAVANATNSPFACAVSSATAGLHLALVGLGLLEGDSVWTTPNTFVATVNAALYCGASVRLIDIDSETLNINLDCLERALQEADRDGQLPKIVIPVHFGGNPVNMEKLSRLSDKYGFKVLEDASHALGSRSQHETIGQCEFSDAAVFSFHPVKPLTSGEGGVITCKSQNLHALISRLRSHGVSRENLNAQHGLPEELSYEQTDLGWNYRLSDINAALGTSQLGKLKTRVEERVRLREIYKNELQPYAVKLQRIDTDCCSSNHLLVAQFENQSMRNEVHNSLRASNIATNFHYIPIYRHPYHKNIGKITDFPIMESYFSTGLTLPLHIKLTINEVKQVCTKIKEVISQ
ncbi:UDP-4-amino-4,6-dideoxy-N-acetyl-beta-L-altrosamine transaminase [Litorivicinus sp.]|nr:UDP-4-amino-4,6-dideoxy-N-acetyl-beta-L-altrosamine transaminase [Litorivicinus sp.]